MRNGMRRTNQTQEDQDEYEARREASEYAAAVKDILLVDRDMQKE